ncbi:MAG: hypothetical protein K2F63_02990, partial [Muribaculaceae bacterium]|nr:hypothetical protein [Muribaculaceae bacterium]
MARRNTSDFIDIQALLRQYFSKWYLFVISVLACCFLAFMYIKIHQPKYAVRANVLISQDDNNNMEAGAMGALGAIGNIFGSDGYVEDEIFIISSHSLYSEVVKELGTNITYRVRTGFLRNELCYPGEPVRVTPAEGMLDTLATSIYFVVKMKENGKTSIKGKIRRSTVSEVKNVELPYVLDTPLGQFTFATTDDYLPGLELKETISVSGYDSAAEDLDMDIQTEIASKRSNVISLGINTTNPEYGKAVLNQIIEEYNKRGINEKNTQTEQTAAFLDGRLEIIARDLDASELAIQSYKQKRGIIDVEVEAKYQTEKRARLDEELVAAATEQEIIAMTGDFLRAPENAFSLVPMTTDNEGLTQSIHDYNEKILERQAIAASAKPDNTTLRRLSEQINMMRLNIISSVDRALQTAKVRVRDLRKEMNSAEAHLGNIPQQEREFINMKRQQEVQAELYLFLLQRREEASLMLANSVAKGKIVDEAFTLSEPLGMSNKAIILIAFVFGLIIPPVLLYFRKLFHNRFETRQDVERLTDVPILGEMCVDRSGNSLVVSDKSTSSSAELFRLMRSNLLFILNDPRDKVVLLTSSTSGEGKSFISINLAASLALMKKKVLLVGMDIRNPRLSDYLEITPRFGLTQYLTSSEIRLDQIISPMPAEAGFDVICAGPIPPNPA